MPLNPEQMDRFIDDHFGYEGRDDVEGVLSTMAEDAEHDVVGWPTGATRGRENARPFYNALFADFEESRVTKLRRLYGANFLIDESRFEAKAVGRPYGIEGKGRPVAFRLLHVVEFKEDGRIAREQVWADVSAIRQQLA